MKALIVIIIAVAIGILGWFLVSRVKVSVEPMPSVSAQEGLPEDVTRFTDGAVTCYVFEKWMPIRSTDSVGGISCVK